MQLLAIDPPAPPTLRAQRRAELRYALSDLTHRRGVSGLCLLAATFAAVLLWQLGALAAALTHSRSERLAAEEPNAIRVRVSDAADTAARFTPQRLRELRRLPGVTAADALFEVQVLASLHEGRERLVPAEGEVRPQPLPEAARVWGEGACGDGVLLTQALFEALGGQLGPAGPEPASLRLRVQRTVRGVAQEHRRALPIRGVLRRQQDGDRIDLAVGLARQLDQWCHGEEVPGWQDRRHDVDTSGRGGVVGEFGLAEVGYARGDVVALVRELSALGFSLAADDTSPPPELNVGRVRRVDRAALTPRDLVALDTLTPLLRWVRPLCEVTARHGGADLSLQASTPQAASLGPPLTAGRWPSQWGEITWPDHGEVLSGDRVELEFVALDGATCRVPFEVCGLVAADCAVPSAAVLGEVCRWQRGELQFVAATQRFAPLPAPTRVHAAPLRATVCVEQLEDVAPLVSHLRSHYGYETRDQVNAFAAVRWFGYALSVLVACIVGGVLLLAMVMTIGMNVQKLQANVFEIGLLRSFALPDARIVKIYALQGLVLGVSALSLAAMLQAVVGPLFRQSLANAFNLELGQAGVFGPWQLIGLVGVVCVGCGVTGTAAPAYVICRRLALVDALRR